MGMMFKDSIVDAVLNNPDGQVAVDDARRAGEELRAVLERSPTLRDVVRKRLSERFERLGKSLDVERLYINTGADQTGIESRPSGSILDVFFALLKRAVYPSYIQNYDFVYLSPGTTDAHLKSRV